MESDKMNKFHSDLFIYFCLSRVNQAASFVSSPLQSIISWIHLAAILRHPTYIGSHFWDQATAGRVRQQPGIDIASTNVSFNDSLKLLGVTLDATFSFDKHVSNVVRSCTFHTRDLRHIRPLLTVEAAKTAAAAIVGTRLDYCNSLLYGSMDRNLNRLQRAQNTLARVVLQAPRSASTNGLRQKLHWLPIRQRVVFKMATVTFKAKNLGQLVYLHNMLQEYQPTRTLRSSTAHLLHHPYASTSVSSRAFSVAAPTIWNQMTVNTRTANTLGTFKTRLKTELFTPAYPTIGQFGAFSASDSL